MNSNTSGAQENRREIESVRLARAELLHLSEPEDSVVYGAVELLGAPTVADVLSGRHNLRCSEIIQKAGARGRELALDQAEQLVRALADRTQRWRQRRLVRPVEHEITAAKHIDAWLCIPEDPDWPQQFTDLGNAQPLALWGRGDRSLLGWLKVEDCVSVVGSRDSTTYGISATTHLAGDLAAHGKTIISGGAFGIDSVAHRSALATSTAPVPTVAFMAAGPDRFYPKHNESLLQEIMEKGLLLGEVPPGFSPTRWRFLQRNRMIAALSMLTLVVEARWRSGALNTAHHALELGRELRAVPGQIFSPSSEGCHRLIRDHLAGIATDAATLIDDCRTGFDSTRSESSRFIEYSEKYSDEPYLTEAQKRLWDALPLKRHATVDRLCGISGMDPRTVLLTLSQLQQLELAEQKSSSWRKSTKYRPRNTGSETKIQGENKET